ncbi:MAG: hypothetical protein V3S55_09610 [Nitrospiraceae bacterium]
MTPQEAKDRFKLWVQTARDAGYARMADWGNFDVEVDHSALLTRILDGKDPLREKPVLKNGYPDYSWADDADVEVPREEDVATPKRKKVTRRPFR